jgi:hypothetical protein
MHALKWLKINSKTQSMLLFEGEKCISHFLVSTAKNGMGEQVNSYQTPRGWHMIADRIGMDVPFNGRLVSRLFTGELCTDEAYQKNPDTDWILTRILRLKGLEEGRNKSGLVDTYDRYIYIHGTPKQTILGKPGSKGCIRMSNEDILALFSWIGEDEIWVLIS